jgi:transposase
MIHNFIGIDIGKFTFVVAASENTTTNEYENSSDGIAKFLEDYKKILPDALSVLETTGGYELKLLYTLCQHGFAVHRADTRKVKNFIRSFGSQAKTDALDAKALAQYGKERIDKLELFKPQSQEAIKLFQLVQRRNDLKHMVVAEKNRRRESADPLVQNSIKEVITLLEKQIDSITQQIKKTIKSDPILKAKLEILKTVPGIGEVVAFELITLLPELGKLTRKKIAALAGLAPKANDSGCFRGYRKTGYGRNGVKPILFMAAMAARNSKTSLKIFYEKLISNGKKKMVALTALMRKILVIANARLKELAPVELPT